MSLRLGNLDNETTETARSTFAKVDDDASTTPSRTANPALVNVSQGIQRNTLVLCLKKICWHLEYKANPSMVTLGSRSERLLLGQPLHLYFLR